MISESGYTQCRIITKLYLIIERLVKIGIKAKKTAIRFYSRIDESVTFVVYFIQYSAMSFS